MKVEVLKSALSSITTVTDSPILMFIEDGVFCLGGYSDTATVIVETPVDDPEIRVVLPPEHAKQLAKSLRKSGEVNLAEDDENLLVTTGKSITTYTTMDVNSVQYKLLSRFYKEDFQFVVDSTMLTKALQVVSSFLTDDINDTRAKNYHISVEGGQMELATSNGSILGVYRFQVDDDFGGNTLPVSLVSRTLGFMSKTFGSTMRIGFNESRMYYKGQSDTLTFKVTLPMVDSDGFPYKTLVEGLTSDPDATSIIVDKEDLLEETKGVMYFTEETLLNRVKISFKPEGLTIQGNNDRGSFSIELDAISSDSDAEMYSSLAYINKATGMVSSSEVHLKISKTMLVVEDNNFVTVIPPLRS